ncbi:MAG: zinc ribbon domain-containing protein, partial [Arthrobacter sp.]
MTDDAERCPRCQQPLRPGAAFCTSCGTPLSNRSARNTRNVRDVLQPQPIPGSIPVTLGPAPGLGQGGGPSMPGKLEVVPATAGKRLGAAVLDWLPPVTVLTILLAVGFAGITRSQSGGFIVYDTSSLVL